MVEAGTGWGVFGGNRFSRRRSTIAQISWLASEVCQKQPTLSTHARTHTHMYARRCFSWLCVFCFSEMAPLDEMAKVLLLLLLLLLRRDNTTPAPCEKGSVAVTGGQAVLRRGVQVRSSAPSTCQERGNGFDDLVRVGGQPSVTSTGSEYTHKRTHARTNTLSRISKKHAGARSAGKFFTPKRDDSSSLLGSVTMMKMVFQINAITADTQADFAFL